MQYQKYGFTLVELSIVLVIIGLIIGGVLVGQDLIQSSKMKAQIRQLGEIELATLTFIDKYEDVPGDCAQRCDSSAGSFNLVDFGTAVANYNNDGMLSDSMTDTTGTITERSSVFPMLAGAGLIAGSTSPATYPAMPLIENGEIGMSSDRNKKLFLMVGKAPSSGSFLDTGSAMTGYQTWRIDTIHDDGMPNTGRLRLADPGRSPSGALGTLHFEHFRYGNSANGLDSNCITGANASEKAAETAEYVFSNETVKNCPLGYWFYSG